MEEKTRQHIRWREPEASSFPANGFHSKVNRTSSVGGPGGHHQPATSSPLTHPPSIIRRSSPDGSAATAAAEPEPPPPPGHLPPPSTATIGRKQIDEQQAFLSTPASHLRYVDDDDDAKKTNAGNGQAQQPDTAAGGHASPTAEITQPYLGQNGGDDDECAANRQMDPPLLLELEVASDSVYSPVASDSRGELLQCEGGSVALEDVLRHYWLLSDRDDEPPKRRDVRSTVSDDNTIPFGGYDWTGGSKRTDANRSQPGLSDWIVRSPEIMLPLDCDDDADSVVTLSTISEEDEDDISSVSDDADSTSRMSENGGKSFRDTSGDVIVEHDASTDFVDVDFLSDDDDNEDDSDDAPSDLGKVTPVSSEHGGSPMNRSPDGVEDDRLPSSSSMVDSFVRSFSDYVSDTYPYGSNVYAGEGTSACHSESDPSVTPASDDDVDGCREYTVTDTLLHIKLVTSMEETDFSRRKLDQSTSTIHDQSSEMYWSPCDVRSSITSPTSWYTVSDIFNSLSFETASEMADDNADETAAAVSTANATCTAVARCLAGPLSPQPSLDHLPSSTVSVTVTDADPFAAIGRAAARAASQATTMAVRGGSPTPEISPDVVEIVVTTTCVMSRINRLEVTEGNSNEDLKHDAAVETQRCSVDVATQISIHNNSFDYDDDGYRPISAQNRFQANTRKQFRNAPNISGAYFAEVGVDDEWRSAVDEATQGTYSYSVAVPCGGPDGDVGPQRHAEDTYLPLGTGAGTNDNDFEVASSVAIKEPARKRKAVVPEKTVGEKDEERSADVVRFGLYTILGSTERGKKENICDKTTEEDFRKTLKHYEFLTEKRGNTIATIGTINSSQTGTVEKSPAATNHKEFQSMDLKPVLHKPLECGESATETCDGIPKIEMASADLNRQLANKDSPPTVVSSGKSQQLDTVDNKLVSQNKDANKVIAAHDKSIKSEVGTDPQDPVTKNSSDVPRRNCNSTSPRQLISDEKNSKRDGCFRVQKSQSLLLETDIDTLEHRKTPVPRKGSRGPGSETKSCTDLSSSRVSPQCKPHSFPYSFGRGNDPPIDKEALAELLSDSASSAGSCVKKKPSLGSGPHAVAHCLSEPALQLSPGKESTNSRTSTGSRRSFGTRHLMERFSSGTRWRMYRSQETVSTSKRPITSSPTRTGPAKLIECYEQSPTLRRRSLHIIETSLQQRRASETSAAVQRSQSLKTPPSQRLSPDGTGVKRHSSSPASSSFENLVDSLLGITAVMSMGAAVSHTTRSSYVVLPSQPLEPLGEGKSPKNLHRSFSTTSPTSATQSDARKTRFETGNEARPVDQLTVPLVDLSGSPVHANTAVRKHVHFRKAKHIFRKCHFCIDANETRSGSSTPSKSPSHHEATRKKTSHKKRH